MVISVPPCASVPIWNAPAAYDPASTNDALAAPSVTVSVPALNPTPVVPVTNPTPAASITSPLAKPEITEPNPPNACVSSVPPGYTNCIVLPDPAPPTRSSVAVPSSTNAPEPLTGSANVSVPAETTTVPLLLIAVPMTVGPNPSTRTVPALNTLPPSGLLIVPAVSMSSTAPPALCSTPEAAAVPLPRVIDPPVQSSVPEFCSVSPLLSDNAPPIEPPPSSTIVPLPLSAVLAKTAGPFTTTIPLLSTCPPLPASKTFTSTNSVPSPSTPDPDTATEVPNDTPDAADRSSVPPVT